MCVQVTKTANRFEISSLLEKILLKQVRWCLTFVGLYILLTHTNHIIDKQRRQTSLFSISCRYQQNEKSFKQVMVFDR